jgi:uncharacterized membrane protein (UPF0182 family)
MRWRSIAGVIAFLVTGAVALGLASDFLVDWLWFSAVGYREVFLTTFSAKAGLFGAVFVGSAIPVWVSGTLALRYARQRGSWLPVTFNRGSRSVRTWSGTTLPDPVALKLPQLPWRWLIAAVAIVTGFLIAEVETANWSLVLSFLHQMPYGQRDPIYGKDFSFYLFSLPAFVALKNWMLLILDLSVAVASVVYWAHGDIGLAKGRQGISSAAMVHGSALLGLFFVVMAWSYSLDRFLLLYGDNGIVVGAGYTDIHVELPVLWALVGIASVAALLSWANVQRRTYTLPLAAVVLVFGSSFVLAVVFPALFQRFSVKPNELQLETPYLEQNIALTREAYNLRKVTVKPFPAEQRLTAQSLQANRATIDNIRLWDVQPLMDTYAQLQEIRTYYKFHDVDIDRYELDGSYQQIMLSARELELALLPPNAQTWVNRHLLFTHGTGVVSSPVTRISAEGLPLLYLKDIPPAASSGPSVSEPRIYFGQGTDSFVIVNGSTPEFDYPKGKDNIYTVYDGHAGVAVSATARRLLFSWYFSDPNILLSRYIVDGSRILFRRNIQERIRTIAPFLRLDRDPYLVISEGRLFWMQDAYTTSLWFPYAQPLPNGTSNYIRNSVKIILDAYQGTVDFYVADPSDPIAATYQRIFPGLFKPLQAMPLNLQKHIRYPEDLFRIQAQIYRAYHMDAPEVFYNREDLWQVPRQLTDLDRSADARMAPYYITMRLPGEARAEFFLMLPMVPSQRENMIAWLAARCDPPGYGTLTVYEFPKDKLVYGPFQIEARINQNTEISQQISLWNQMGSRVIRGHLMVVPIEDSLLYVSPLYLRAETGQLPELKRVIAAYGDHVVMAETLAGALAALFTEPAPAVPAPPPTDVRADTSPAGPMDNRAREALGHYDRALERLKAGDWGGFGAELDALRALLEALGQHPGDG